MTREPLQVGDQRWAVDAVLRRWGVDGDSVYSVVLVMSELLSNAVLYGRDDVVGLHVAIDGVLSTVLVEVNDHTPGPRAAPRLPGDDQESGRGLILVGALAETWGVSSDGAVTWCKVRVAAGGVR
ncbi:MULTISPECIES: ATP-binding protein [unclassified Streptomyces]|uniref:ATP-binding protein n=1 Tax=unclassified Streptomyces TaxID=2593676 RepID=UPI0013011643|nr:ATP-binding protein [Streptomyces sp. TSRI0281]